MQPPQGAPSSIGTSNGAPQAAQKGGAMKWTPRQQTAQSVPCAATGASQARQSGGSSKSSARAITRWKGEEEEASDMLGSEGRLVYPTRMKASGQIAVFDRALLRARRDRAAGNFAAHGALFDEIAAQLIERLGGIKQEFGSALDLGAHAGGLAQELARKVPFVVATDISEKMARGAGGSAVVADEELLPFAPGSFDLIVSNLSLHWVNDLPGTLAQIRTALRPGGVFLASLIGGGSLHELRASLMEAELAVAGGVGPRLSPAVDLSTASALLQRAGFALPVTDMEQVTLLYKDMLDLMRDLRGMGESAAHFARPRQPAQRRVFHEAARLYKERFGGVDGRIPASLEIIFWHGVKS